MKIKAVCDNLKIAADQSDARVFKVNKPDLMLQFWSRVYE